MTKKRERRTRRTSMTIMNHDDPAKALCADVVSALVASLAVASEFARGRI